MGFLSKTKKVQDDEALAATTVNADLPIAAVVVDDGQPLKQHQPAQQQHIGAGASVFIDSRRPVTLHSCPHCGASNVKTQTRTAPSILTWLAAGVTLIVLWPVCWLPLVLDSCKDTQHFCSSCSKEVGKVGSFQDCCVTQRG